MANQGRLPHILHCASPREAPAGIGMVCDAHGRIMGTTHKV